MPVVPAAKDGVTIVRTAGLATARESCLAAVDPLASVAVTVKTDVAAPSGVPEIAPSGDKESPSGKLPAVTAQA